MATPFGVWVHQHRELLNDSELDSLGEVIHVTMTSVDTATEESKLGNGKSITIAVFIDALGWQLAKEHGFLKDLLTHRGPLGTTFGYSSTCDPTIVTGLKPRDHGHFAFFTYDPVNSPFKSIWWPRLLPRFVTRRGRVRRWVSRLVRRQIGYTGYFQLYNTPFHLLSKVDYTEKRDLYQPNGINGGQSTLFDELRHAGIPFHLSNWRQDEATNLRVAHQDISTGKPKFAYIFLAELDAILHAEGTASPKVTQKLYWYEEQVTQLLCHAQEHYDHVSLCVFSDHGMTDIQKECPLMQSVESLPLELEKDYFAIYDSTMARFWFMNEHAKSLITDTLRRNTDGHWLTPSTLEAWGCDFPDERYGESFFLLNPGVLLNPSYMGDYRLAGMHGFDPLHADSVAFFATNDRTMEAPRCLEDLRRVLMQSMRQKAVGIAA